jgi:hypothetical protein
LTPLMWKRTSCSAQTVGLDGVPDGYRAMAQREAIKVMVRP